VLTLTPHARVFVVVEAVDFRRGIDSLFGLVRDVFREDAFTGALFVSRVLDRGPLATAIDYALSNWTALTQYVNDGRIPIDNNAAERALRAVAVGRKNWMMIGNVRGGRNAAVLYSLVQTARAICIDPKTDLADVLERVAVETDVTKLTPHGWKQRFWPLVAAERDRFREAAVASS
jgi:hypothetical protein